MKDKTAHTKFNNIITYLFSFLASGIGIFLNFFLARVLQADAYGEIQYYVALCTTISSVFVFGINSFLIREAKNEKQDPNLLNRCLTLYFVIILFLTPILYFILLNYIGQTASNISLSVLIIGISVLIGLNTIFAANFQGKGQYKFTVIFDNLIPKFFILLISLVFVLIGKNYIVQKYYLIFYLLIYACVVIPLLCINFRKLILNFCKDDIKSIVFFFGVTITYSLGNNLTKVLQGWINQNNIALAIISVSMSIVSLVKVFTSVLDNMLKPIFAKQKREKDIDGLLETYRFDTRVNTYFSIPLYLFFIFCSQKFLSIFGSSYTEFPRILAIISLANFISDVTGPSGTMLSMSGNEKLELYNGLAFFITYFACIFLFSSDQIYGLCYALLAAQFVVNVIKFIEVWAIFKKIPLDPKSILTLIIIALINGAIIFALSLISSFAIWIIISLLVGVLLVLLNAFVFSLYRKKDIKTLISVHL